MSTTEPSVIKRLAEELFGAWNGKTKVAPFTHAYPDITLEDAYAVQAEMLALLLQSGYSVSGKKLGYTNPAMQKKMGLAGPSYGFLFSGLRYNSGETVPFGSFIQPGIETEILFRISEDLNAGPYTVADIPRIAETFRISMEIVDMRQLRVNKTQRDSVGDEGAFGAYVAGAEFRTAETDLASLNVQLIKNGTPVQSGTGENVMNGPLNALLWAANTLSGTEHYLKAGEELLSGSFTPLDNANAGDAYSAVFGDLGTVEITFG